MQPFCAGWPIQNEGEEFAMGMTVPGDFRKMVVGMDEPVRLEDGRQCAVINFDNAATTPALVPVVDEVNEKLRMYGSIGRGFSAKSDYTTEIYEAVRRKVLRFFDADDGEYACFFVNGTTDGLNKLASALIESRDDVVLATRMEHHSNDLPWRERCHVLYAEVDEQGRLRYEEIERLLRENQVKLVSVTAASNVTGYVTDVHRIAEMAHRYGARIIVDGAQIAAHRLFSMRGGDPVSDIDYFTFSAHKMYAPYGGGAVVARKSELELCMPKVYGGGTTVIVSDRRQYYEKPPGSFEAGSPNYAGAVALAKAIELLSEADPLMLREHELALTRRLIDGLHAFGFGVYGDAERIEDRVGVVAFNDPQANSCLLAKQIAGSGAAVRRGAFCANPYVWRLLGIPDDEVVNYKRCAKARTPGMIRVSFGIYNTEEEVDEFLRILPGAIERARAEQALNPDAAPTGY